ncbi:sensor histidine kinase [Candidatus Nitrosotenuis uzonensis]|uniref:sensor histidine kinase n=1 Tax=Candidatus Nitrosotenuis uzonensis TaxID=1407055 RepID=UPI001961E41C|nr:HAMP domain-containing sensor histidine kinase [Candidatus Nitrosotenuis uzonensis]
MIPVLLTAYNLNIGSESLSLGVSLAYPITDVLLLFLAITCVLSMRGTADRFLILLIAGIASFIVSDILYLTVYDTYENGNIIDVGWIFGYIFFAFAITKFEAGTINTKPESTSLRYEMIPKFVVPFAIFVGFAIILSYAANLYPVIQDTHSQSLVEGIMYLASATMIVLAVMAFFINKNTDQLVKKITRQLEIEHNRLKAKNEENDLLLQKLESQNFELKKIDRLKDEFSSMITHELKTPLAPILSWCGVLKSQKDFDKDPIRIKAIQKIESNALKLSQLISDILDAEKLELSKMPFHKKEFSVSDLVTDIYENYKNIMEKQATSFNVSCDPKIVLVSDIDRIEQVLKNFINNSMDFVPKSSGKIELKVEQQGDKILFQVIDNGIGISKENQQNLFKKFYQIDNSVTRRHGGSGLGLSICKEIVENLGGEIGVQSELGKGSTFYFTLPVTHLSNNVAE